MFIRHLALALLVMLFSFVEIVSAQTQSKLTLLPTVEHTVSGTLEKGQCTANELVGATIILEENWYIKDKSSLVVPWGRRYDGGYGYDILKFANGKVLEQRKELGRGSVDADNRFKINWKEPPVFSNRVPWIHNVYRISPDTVDPSDPLGFKKSTVYRVLHLRLSIPGLYTVVDSNSEPWIMFYNQETTKELGEITVHCFEIDG